MRGDIRTEARPATGPEDAPKPEREDHPLKRKWFIALVVLGMIIWFFFGAMAVMPMWLWITILAILIAAALAIALFGPRSQKNKQRFT